MNRAMSAGFGLRFFLAFSLTFIAAAAKADISNSIFDVKTADGKMTIVFKKSNKKLIFEDGETKVKITSNLENIPEDRKAGIKEKLKSSVLKNGDIMLYRRSNDIQSYEDWGYLKLETLKEEYLATSEVGENGAYGSESIIYDEDGNIIFDSLGKNDITPVGKRLFLKAHSEGDNVDLITETGALITKLPFVKAYFLISKNGRFVFSATYPGGDGSLQAYRIDLNTGKIDEKTFSFKNEKGRIRKCLLDDTGRIFFTFRQGVRKREVELTF